MQSIRHQGEDIAKNSASMSEVLLNEILFEGSEQKLKMSSTLDYCYTAC